MTKKITTTAVLFALSTVLSLITVLSAPYGGSITPASMLPIILISLKYKTSWGLLSAFVFSAFQMFLGGGIPAPPVQNLLSYFEVIMLDYVIAFGVLGLAHSFYTIFGKNNKYSLAFASASVIFLRFICHFLSGIIIWGIYAPEGTSPAIYSLLYNGGYMLPEIIITTAIVILVTPKLKKLIEA